MTRLRVAYDTKKMRGMIIKALLVGAAIGAGVLLLAHLGFELKLSAFKDISDSIGTPGPIILILGAIALSCLFFPSTVITILFGALYGPWLGALCAVIILAVSSLIELVIGRYVVSDDLKSHYPERIQRFDGFVERRGWIAIMQARLMPGAPNTLINYSAGATKLSMRHMLIGSVIGSIPKALLYATFGEQLESGFSWILGLAFAGLVLVTILSAWLARFLERRDPSPGSSSGE